jgi:hypothetical protein
MDPNNTLKNWDKESCLKLKANSSSNLADDTCCKLVLFVFDRG